MEEEEGRRDGSYFNAEGTADGSGLAGAIPLPSSTTSTSHTGSGEEQK